MSDYKVQSVLFPKTEFNINTASNWLLKNGYLIKKVDITKDYLRFRQATPYKLKKEGYVHFVSKHLSNNNILLIIAYKGVQEKGGKISVSNLKNFINESYKKTPNENIDGYQLDKELSNNTAKVFYNPTSNHAVVSHRGTEGTLKDWSNNLAYLTGLYKYTNRYNEGKKAQEQAEKKYKPENISTIGHSQGSILSRELGKNSKEIINLNPAYLGEKPNKNEYNIRSSSDIVSGLLPFKHLLYPSSNDVTIQSKNPKNIIDEHSTNILNRLNPDLLIGEGRKRKLNNWVLFVKNWSRKHHLTYAMALRQSQLKDDYNKSKKSNDNIYNII